MLRVLLSFLFLFLAACGDNSTKVEDLLSTELTLPNRQKISAQTMLAREDMMHGMMFRDQLAPDRGLLFIHASAGNYPYWMFQVKVPLDIIWLDSSHRIVEISADTPPCKTQASQCANYGGSQQSQYVLELAGGMARKYGLKAGDEILF